MTSTTGADGHPEVAEISAFTEGVLSPARTTDLREHLAACELCEDVHSSLNEIRGALGTLPGPMRMPADIAGRIDAALAAEALLDATAPSVVSRETTASTPGTVSRETAPAGTKRVSRETIDRPAGRPHAPTGPGRRSRPALRHWPMTLLGAACAAAVIGVGALFLQSDGDGTQAQGVTPNASTPRTFPVGDLSARVHDLLRSRKSTETRGLGVQDSSETLRDSGTTVPVCVRQGIGRPDPFLATHAEKYSGKDAYLVILPHPDDESLVDVFVVDSTCASLSPPRPGKILVNRTMARS